MWYEWLGKRAELSIRGKIGLGLRAEITLTGKILTEDDESVTIEIPHDSLRAAKAKQ